MHEQGIVTSSPRHPENILPEFLPDLALDDAEICNGNVNFDCTYSL